MVAGHLQEKNGYYYAVLNYREEGTGKRRQPWIPTGLPVKGNKKRAEQKLMEIRRDFEPPKAPASATGEGGLSPEMLFADFMLTWLTIAKGEIEITTYSSYSDRVKGCIEPYFRELGITLSGLEARHIQMYYLKRLEEVSGSTVHKEHANIHRALRFAVQMDLIPYNAADKVQVPKINHFVGNIYSIEELTQLFDVSKNHKLGLLIQFTSFYGLRRSEALGLKWDAIDFEHNSITIRHIVTETRVDGKQCMIRADRTKNKSSRRSLPLVVDFRERLLTLREQQEQNKRVCGNSYNTEYIDYVFVDEMGNLFKPGYVSDAFSKILKKNGLRHIRYHDLRHSCASLLIKSGVSDKQVQEWLGHSDISTTMNIYAHLDDQAKLASADTMAQVLKLPEVKTQSW